MSYQYIYPQIPYYTISYPPIASCNATFANSGYCQNPLQINPYTYSFYSPGAIDNTVLYPYSQLNTKPLQNSKYAKIGEIKSPTNETVNLYQLSNGHRVAIMPRKNQAAIVKTFLNDGAITENDKQAGIMHVIEHCVFKGSDKLNDGDVFKLTGQMGADTNASTDFAKVDYYISAPYLDKDDIKKCIEIQADMLTNPKFNSDALESEKNPVCSEISMMNDDPTTFCFDRVIRNLFQIQSDAKNIVAGSIGTVQGLSREDVIQKHKNAYSPDNICTVVIGDVDVNETIENIANNFNFKKTTEQTKERELKPIQKPLREDYISTKTNLTTVIMGFCGPKPDNSKDFVIKSMINNYLEDFSTSCLKNELEKINGSYASTVQKVGINNDDPYALISILALNPGDEQKGLDIFYDAIYKLQNEPLGDDDLAALKKRFEKSIQYFDSEEICDNLGTSILDNSLDSFSNIEEIANSITKEDITNFAKKYYDLNKVSIVVLHPDSVSEEDINKNWSQSKYSKKSDISFTGGVKKLSTDDIEEYILENNTRLALNDTNSSLCVFDWCVETPPIKPKNPNIPAVLSYMFQKGSEYKNQSELERYKELNGIRANVYTNGRSIQICADCLEDNIDDTLSLINELLYHPKFSENDFRDAKKYIKENLLLSEKDANSTLLDKIFNGYFSTDSQKLKTIDELTLDDIKEFYNELLKNASSTFCATIPMKKNPLLKQKVMSIQGNSNILFKDSTPKLHPMYETNNEANVIYDIDDLNQAQIYKSYKFPLSGNIDDEVKFELVNAILGGSPDARLFSDLRDKQNLAYSVSSSISSFENSGILTLKIQTTTDNKEENIQSYDNVEKSLEGFKKHTKALCEELVSDDELKAAKMKLKQNIIGQCQDPYSETDLLMTNMLEPFGIKRIDKYIEAIDKATKEDVIKAANHIFSQNPTISILASEDTINSQMEYLKKQGVLYKAD